MDTMPVPPWLESLLSTSFFTVCRTHGDAARNECNMYCLDCEDKEIFISRCSEGCRDSKGTGHKWGSNLCDKQSRVLFLNERPQPKYGKGVAHICVICGRSLLDPFRFCSLGCKLVGVKRNGDASFTIEAKNEALMERREGISRGEEELREGSQQDIYPPMPPPPPSSARRRKGIPHRAPFRS